MEGMGRGFVENPNNRLLSALNSQKIKKTPRKEKPKNFLR